MRARAAGCVLALMLLAVAVTVLYHRDPRRGLPYHSNFAAHGGAEWTAYGGSWDVEDDRMHNASDERGAKLVAGPPYWRDYMLDTDLRFLGEGGDVGVTVRSRDEEVGVDAYNGYYVGLRIDDNSLVIGRAGFGWIEAPPVRLPQPVRALRWYHLKVVAVGCRIAAAATDLSSGATSYVALQEQPCVRAGRIGLRSLSTGGEWRNVSVVAAGEHDLQRLLRHTHGVETLSFPREAEYNRTHAFLAPINTGTVAPAKQEAVAATNIAALRGAATPRVIVRGVVTDVHPALYVQDASGGTEVVPSGGVSPVLSLGDEVEVRGDLVLKPFSTLIRNAQLRLLWDRTPAPAVSVTASQAASGDFSGMLIETQGQITGKSTSSGVLHIALDSGDQSFQLLMNDAHRRSRLQELPLHSQVRVRGVCVLDETYTHGITPFALLLRSSNDVQVIAGPPWWTARHLAQGAIGIALILLLVQAYHGRMEERRRAAITHERERLAHDLHDTLAQSFAGVGYQLFGIRNGLRQRERSNFARMDQQLEVASEFVRRAHDEASLSIAMLRSDQPKIRDLQSALERCAAQLTFGGGIQVSVECHGQPRRIQLRVTDALFHIGREALVNAVRHANAKSIRLRVDYARREIALTVEDDGIGFVRDPASTRLGLSSMERRAAVIRADLQIVSAPNAGTRVVVRAPSAVFSRTASFFSRLPLKLRATHLNRA